ncbi:MAG: hypothetical protein AAFY17_09370 [Cyanobacteria bacterium J06642_11]
MAVSNLEEQFEGLWVELFPALDLHSEHRFHPVRRWRFDYAHLPSQVAIELEGGVFRRGRHTRGAGYVKDCEKYLNAAALGWTVCRLATGMVTVENLELIAKTIEGRVAGTFQA